MGMQTDVKQAHLNGSGFFVVGRNRVKGLSMVGSGAADGTLVLFDAAAAPVTASVTYARSGTTVTVTKTAHGLTSGAVIGIHFETGTGGTATDGTYTVTRIDADNFSMTDINTGSITGTPAAVYAVGRWLLTYEIDSTDTFQNAPFIPGEGVLATTAVYGYLSNIQTAQIYYG
jgi:hypothetical protein